MSYILEGFKKLERSHQRIGGKGLFATNGNAPPGRRRRKLRKYLLLLALIIFLVAAATAYRWYSTATFARSDGLPKQQVIEIEEAQSQTPQANATQRETIQEEQRPLDPPLVEKRENLMTAEEHQPVQRSPRRKESLNAENAQAGGEESVPPGAGERIILLSQLPEDVKKSMPEVKVFLHYYSPEAKERFVQINELTLHEGQVREDGLKVLRITQQAAIFFYQGHRFQMRAIEK